ncbi:hypothetical protein [Sorangium sp. So ce854]|uniref:hypothetical protein n=1 Tax=Sorangium sp. So ce854 TaxID=3133322 RepID=UPI000A913828
MNDRHLLRGLGVAGGLRARSLDTALFQLQPAIELAPPAGWARPLAPLRAGKEAA